MISQYLSKLKEGTGLVMFAILVVVVFLVVLLMPLAAIWAINCLFPALAIPYSFWTWLAVVVLTNYSTFTIKQSRK